MIMVDIKFHYHLGRQGYAVETGAGRALRQTCKLVDANYARLPLNCGNSYEYGDLPLHPRLRWPHTSEELAGY